VTGRRWRTAAAVLVLAVGVLALVASVGQRLAAQVTLADADRRLQEAAAARDDAATRAGQAADRFDAATAGAAQAQAERSAAQQALADERARLIAADLPGRLAAVDELAALGAEQADRFDAMNGAALAGEVAVYNRLVRAANAATERSTVLWRALLATDPGVEPGVPLA
jgi:hypothetical protein